MKITIYELLGMVKDGKSPIKIKYNNMIWEYDGDYYSSKNNIILEEYCYLTTSLNDEVEILEEKKIPEKLDAFDIQGLEVSGYSMTQAEYLLEDGIKENREMINWILDYLKSKGDE